MGASESLLDSSGERGRGYPHARGQTLAADDWRIGCKRVFEQGAHEHTLPVAANRRSAYSLGQPGLLRHAAFVPATARRLQTTRW